MGEEVKGLDGIYRAIGELQASQKLTYDRQVAFEKNMERRLSDLMLCSKSNANELIVWATYRRVFVGLLGLGLVGWAYQTFLAGG